MSKFPRNLLMLGMVFFFCNTVILPGVIPPPASQTYDNIIAQIIANTDSTDFDLGLDWSYLQSIPAQIAVAGNANGGTFTNGLSNDYPADRVLFLNYNGLNVDTFTIETTDRKGIELDSFQLGNNLAGYSTSLTVSVYSNDVLVGSAIIDLNFNSTSNGITYTYGGNSGGNSARPYGTLTFDATYVNVNKIRLTYSSAATPLIDNLNVSPVTTISGNAGIPGAKLSWTDSYAKTTVADSIGNYSFNISYNWSGTVTPSKNYTTFTPASKTYSNVTSDQTAQNYTALLPAPAGSGTSADPYQIANLENLYWLSQTSSAWGKYFIQTADIDASSSSVWDSGAGFSPIGNSSTSFTGSYDGQRHTITGLYIKRGAPSWDGLFGYIYSPGIVKNIGLINVDIQGYTYAGGLAGYNRGIIYNSYSTGSVSASSGLGGGLAGSNYGTISNSYSTVSVTGGVNVGGLAGENSVATITNCYSTGPVSGTGDVGGLVGTNGSGPARGTVSNSFSTGLISGTGSYVGGLIGYGDSTYTSNSFWDTQTSGLSTSRGGTGKTTSEMKVLNTFFNAGWDFDEETINGTNDYWDIDNVSQAINSGYPFLAWQNGASAAVVYPGAVLDSLETAELSFKEGDSAKQVTGTITLSDIYKTNIDSAVVFITANYVQGEDTLVYSKVGNITGAFIPASGTMLLSGVDTKANYQSALRSIKYFNRSQNPSTTPRTVKFYVNDGRVNSDTLSRKINVTAVNNRPLLANIESAELNFTEGDPAAQITGALTLSDVDNTNMDSAIVKISSGYLIGEDSLLYSKVGNISGVFNSSGGEIILTGSDTKSNYEAALRSVKYKNSSQNPSTVVRTISFYVNDGSTNSDTASRKISITAVNNSPMLANIETTALSFTESNPATQVTGTITLSDVDNSNMDSAVVKISSGYLNGEDSLLYSKVGNINGTFNTSTGEISLTGSDSKANYQVALRSVKYINTSQNPSTSARTISFYVNDGSVNSDTLSRIINITAINNSPVIAGIDTAAINYTEGSPAAQISKTININDIDNSNMDSAVVQIASGYMRGEDTLQYLKVGNIAGTFDGVSGKILLTGSDTKANYQLAIEAVRYFNLSSNPSTAERTVTVFVNDGALNSDTLSKKLNVIAVNNPPALAGAGNTAVNYTEKDPAVQITGTITVSDVDNTNMDSASVQITAGYVQGEDTLEYQKVGNISGVFDSANGKILLTGNDTKADYQSALRNVKYKDKSNNPSTGARTVSFTVNDGSLNSLAITRRINVLAVNDAPVLAGIESTVNGFTEGSGAVQITDSVEVSDVDNIDMNSAVVWISSNYVKGEDSLRYSTTGNITGSFDPETGRLLLSGIDTKANYRLALRSVDYLNSSSNPSTSVRKVSMYVNDGKLKSDTLSRQISITAVNNPPVLADIETTPAKISSGSSAVQVSNTIILTDQDNVYIDSAVVKISSDYQQGKDTLIAPQIGKINVSFRKTSGELLLYGKDTKADYQKALRSVMFKNTASSPIKTTREISLLVNDGQLNSNTLTRKITIIPSVFFLYHNYPNPFNPSTTIAYSLPQRARVHLVVYDILGRRVAELINKEENAGYYRYNYNAGNLASGVYIYVLTTKGVNGKEFVSAKKMILLK